MNELSDKVKQYNDPKFYSSLKPFLAIDVEKPIKETEILEIQIDMHNKEDITVEKK